MLLNDEFFARVGHDLRGELATMLAGIHYVLRYEKHLEPGPRDMIERVRAAGERLRRLLDEFDHAVWIRSDPERSLCVTPYDAARLVQQVAERVEAAASARGVRVETERTEDEGDGGEALPAGDEALIALALDQVVGFAVTRSRDQPVRVALSGRRDVPVVTVIDAAGGIPPAVLEHLLEPFGERAALAPDPVAPRRRERLGLGLAIARGILEAHGGGLDVASASGADAGAEGLRFTCALAGPGRASAPPVPPA